MTVQLIRDRLAELRPGALEIVDESAGHVGHRGASAGGGHFGVYIVSEAFDQLSPLARHRRVYSLLGDLMPRQIHALSLKALAPGEL